MPGRFKKAPLVYVTARIATTPLPTLSADQKAMIQQAMVKCGLVLSEVSKGQSLNFDKLINVAQEETNIDQQQLVTPLLRQGFFSNDRTKCVIFEQDAIEWRAVDYTKYNVFVDEFQNILKTIIDVVDVYGHVITKEFTLSYSDIIVPSNNHHLGDYFTNSEAMLPLTMTSSHQNDLEQVGQINVTRITEPKKKIQISFEQLLAGNKLRKYLSEAMLEPDQAMSMPIKLREEWKNLENIKYYGLLMTQAGMLNESELSKLSFSDTFGELHELTRETFRSLINRDVCDVDWEYISTEGDQ